MSFAIASLVLLIAANAFAFISFDLSGRVQEMHIYSGSAGLAGQGFYLLAGLTMFACILVPFVRLAAALYLALVPTCESRDHYAIRTWLDHLRPWAMLDVFALSVLVAYVKLSQDGDVGLLRGFYPFVALVVLFTLTARRSEASVGDGIASESQAP